jgi:ABC-2 type transport system ATP-binding protein
VATRVPDPSVSPAIDVHGLRKAYGGRSVLADVTFSVGRGEVLALLGPNGAGKTTTVEILEGYRHADAGEVRVLGSDPWRDGHRLRPRVGLMLQDGGVDPRTTPREILRLFARLYAAPADPDALVHRVGLDAVAATRYRRLSGGERQRLSLALALVGRPEVLVLDEPTAGMDPEAKADTRRLISDLRADGATILLTTHDLADVERLGDHVVVLDRGRVVASGRPGELVAGGVSRVRFSLPRGTSDEDLAELRRRLESAVGTSASVVDVGGRWAIDGAPPTPSLVAALARACEEAGILLVDLETGSGSLEERYLELVGRAASDEPDRARGLRL